MTGLIFIAGYALGLFVQKKVGGRRLFYRRAIPHVEETGKSWDDLPSGAAIDLTGDMRGFIAKVDGDPWWWITRHGRTIVEGPALNLAAARLAVVQTAPDFINEA